MSSLNGELPLPDTTVTLQLGADGSASGSDGCNRYWTTFEQDGQNLTFNQPMAGTMMACEKEVMAQASEYQETLATVTSFLRSARQLVLFAGDDIVLTYVAEIQGLEGTSWDVVNYNNGREAVVGVLEGTEITLNFDETDLYGNAGCNNYFAGYTVKGKHILIDPPGATMMFCEDAGRRHGAGGRLSRGPGERRHLPHRGGPALAADRRRRHRGDRGQERDRGPARPRAQDAHGHGHRGQCAEHPLRARDQLPGDRGGPQR